MKKLIELVCTGNNGRSPVAELIARNYLHRVGASEYESISSGTMVEKIKAGGFPIKAMVPILELAKGRGIYDAHSLAELDGALRRRDTVAMEKYFQQASEIFAQEEAEERGKLLKEFGIEGFVKEGRDQTIARPDVVAVLPVDRKNYDGVLGIYQNSGHSPVIGVMSVLATGNPQSEVQNSFGQGVKVYRQRVEQLIEEVPKAVRKIVGT